MSITPTVLIAPQQLTNAVASYYTSTNIKTRIDKLSITNPTGSAATATLYLVPAAGAANAGTTITSAKSVAPGETWNCPDMVSQILLAGGTIQAVASVGATLTISSAGVLIT
jgi:hypothetical protein